jgi:pimeloyl-ACP methyl ester carboxylesterase
MAPLPWTGPILSEISTPLTASTLPGFIAPESASQALQSRIDFVSGLVASPPEDVPFTDYQQWLGSTVLMQATCASFLSTRVQDPTNLQTLVKEGVLPICWIQGKEDGILVPMKIREQTKDLFVGDGLKEIHEIEGVGHMAFWEDPAKVGGIVREFVGKVMVTKV